MFDDPDPLTDDELYGLLINPRRRVLLRHLAASNGSVELEEVSRRIAREEAGVSEGEVDEWKVTSVYVALRRRHVPALEERDVVDVDDGTVSVGGRADEAVAVLRESGRPRRRWALRYLTVAAALGAFAAVSTSRVVALPESVRVSVTLAGAGALVALAVRHYYEGRTPSVEDVRDGDSL